VTDVRFLLFTAETEAHLARATAGEIRQLLSNHVTAENPRGPSATSGADRSLLIGAPTAVATSRS